MSMILTIMNLRKDYQENEKNNRMLICCKAGPLLVRIFCRALRCSFCPGNLNYTTNLISGKRLPLRSRLDCWDDAAMNVCWIFRFLDNSSDDFKSSDEYTTTISPPPLSSYLPAHNQLTGDCEVMRRAVFSPQNL